MLGCPQSNSLTGEIAVPNAGDYNALGTPKLPKEKFTNKENY